VSLSGPAFTSKPAAPTEGFSYRIASFRPSGTKTTFLHRPVHTIIIV
jgi:hypothetical protein